MVLLSQRVLQGLFPVNTGVTGVTDEGIQGLQVREYGDTRGYIVGDNTRFMRTVTGALQGIHVRGYWEY